MTASRTVVYAPGGGAGHLARAMALAGRLGGSTILHHGPAPARVPNGVSTVALPPDAAACARIVRWARQRAERFVVDTFPAGLWGEIDASLAPDALVARHVEPGTYPDYDERAATYRERLGPYPADACEWDEACACTRHVGWLVRRPRIGRGAPADLVVVGEASRLPPSVARALPRGTSFVTGHFDELPPARAYLTVGAGYGIVYELRAIGARAGHVPLERRWDNQFRRAARLGRTVLGPADLARLLDAPEARQCA